MFKRPSHLPYRLVPVVILSNTPSQSTNRIGYDQRILSHFGLRFATSRDIFHRNGNGNETAGLEKALAEAESRVLDTYNPISDHRELGHNV
jgi:hypothetical protein